MNKKLIIAFGSVITVLLAVAIVLFSINQYQQVQAHNEKIAAQKKANAEKKKAAAKQKDKEKNFESAYDLFIGYATDAAAAAETIGSKFHDVWQKTIFDGSVTVSGKKYTDFNDSLEAQAALLVDDKDKAIEDFNSMKEQFDTLQENQTDKNAERYSQAKDLYESVSQFFNLAVSPNGTLETFTEDFNQYDNDVASKIDAISGTN